MCIRDRDITGMKPYLIARLGFARTFQNIRLFSKMSVLDHVILGMHGHTKANLIDAIFHTPKKRREEAACLKRAEEILKLMNLWEDRYALADVYKRQLSGHGRHDGSNLSRCRH